MLFLERCNRLRLLLDTWAESHLIQNPIYLHLFNNSQPVNNLATFLQFFTFDQCLSIRKLANTESTKVTTEKTQALEMLQYVPKMLQIYIYPPLLFLFCKLVFLIVVLKQVLDMSCFYKKRAPLHFWCSNLV